MAKTRADEFPLGMYLEELVETLRSQVTPALEGAEVDAVHDARVATRRLKSAVDLLSPVVPKDCAKPFAKATKNLRRLLGPLRDFDVAIEHLRGMPESYREPADWMIERLAAARQNAVDETAREVSPRKILSKLGSWWGLRDQITAAREAVDGLLAASLREQYQAFSTLAAKLDASGEERTDPHALRIAGKSLRYTVEMARASGHKWPGGVLKSFKRMQEALGLWHDDVVLAEQIMRVSADQMLAHHDAELQVRVLGLAQLMIRRSRQQLTKFAKIWAEQGPAFERVLEALYPLASESISEPQTDRDPADSQMSEATEAPPPAAAADA